MPREARWPRRCWVPGGPGGRPGPRCPFGASGALLGTRFQATPEALVSPTVTKALLEGRGEDTERNRVLDIARGAPWPDRYTARTLRTGFLDRWRD